MGNQYRREELTPGANVWKTGPDPGSAIGMYRLYDAGGGKAEEIFVAVCGP
jgi:hypothetical protein